MFVQNADHSKGMLIRKCTRDYKVHVITRKLRELAQIRRGEKEVQVISYIGISTDEVLRMKPSRVQWIRNEWPLVDADMSRQDCLQWMNKNGYPVPPRSACIYCPYHSDHEWLNLKNNSPKDFADAVNYERSAQRQAETCEVIKGIPFLHSSRVPLDEVVFDTKADRQFDLFNDECEGMCGV